jgi:hypothetical protein
MKTILVPVEDHVAMPAVLEGARLAATLFESYLEGCAVKPFAESFVSLVDPVSGLALSEADEGDSTKQAHDRFEAFMRAHRCRRPGTSKPAVAMAGCGCRLSVTPRSAAMDAYSI